MLERILDFLRLDVETEKTVKGTKTLLTFVLLILILCSVVMSVMNVLNESFTMLATTFSLAVICFICFIICIVRYNRKIIECTLGVTIISLFSFYVVIGGSAGFAIDWILLVPVAYMVLFGLKAGLLVGGYFWLFLVTCLWTPVYHLLPYNYTDEVRLRFPILYTCGFLLAIVIGIKSKNQQIVQLHYEGQLSQAILTERKRVERISMDAISSICRALDAKDTYTKEHSDHVAAYSGMIAQSLGWSERRIEMLVRAAKVHDLGKIGIPDAILKKKGSLNEEEFAIMKQHVEVGAEIASEFLLMPELSVGARYHHERYDGTGYSTGLSGEQIPIEGRIIGLADAIDAMSSDRVYRKRRSLEFILDELRNGAGRQFDPELVEVALTLLNNGMIDKTGELKLVEI